MALKPRRGPGPTARTRTPRWMRPARWPGTGRRSRRLAAGDPRPSATGMPRPGLPPTRRWAGGGRTAPGAWWQPPPTRPPCRPRPPGTWSPTCPAPAARARPDSPHPAAGLAEIVRIYGIRHWIEQSYKQVKDQLGWADFQVRSDTAIRRHQTLVNCAFSFCWDAWFADPRRSTTLLPPRTGPGRGERGATRRLPPAAVLATGITRDTRLAFP